MYFVLLCLAFILSIAAYYIRRWNLNVPGPVPLPLIGNCLDLARRINKDPYDLMLDMSEKYGDVWAMYVPFKPTVYVLSGTEDIKYILEDNFYNYDKGKSVHDALFTMLGNGIFNSDGEDWINQRKFISHMFARKNIINMTKCFHDVFESKEKTLEGFTDIQAFFSDLTLRTICKIAFGFDVKEDKYFSEFQRAFDTAQVCIDNRFGKTLWKYFMTNSEKTLLKCMVPVDDFIYKIVSERLEDYEDRDDMMSKFIASGERSRYKIRDFAINILVAGRDTTSQLLTWLFHLLSKDTHRTEILRKEISENLGEINADNPGVMFNKIESLDYLDKCIDETLRLYPPVPFEIKSCKSTDILPSGKKIVKGSVVCYSPWVLGRMEKYWENPLEFEPERWTSKMRSPPFIPFNYGKRKCLGMRMATYQAKYIACLIISKGYNFISFKEKVHYKRKITLSADEGMYMCVTK